MNTHDLIAAARAAHAETLAAHAETLAAQAQETADASARREEEQQDFLRVAAARATKLFGASAETLAWHPAPEHETREHLSAASAALAPGHAHNARLLYTFDAYNSISNLTLLRTCRSCANELTNEVGSLAELGRLLDDTRHPDTEDQASREEPGPLTAAQVLETRVATMTGLARRLRAEHTDADVAVSHTVLIGHRDATATATLNLTVADINAARTVAAALGVDVVITTVEHGAPYPGVIEHVKATATVDGVDVELTGSRRLTDDEAAAWRVQQNQAAEDEAPAAGGGEG